jgi:hypothetical protein
VDAVTPEEIRRIFFAILDLSENVKEIRKLLEEDDGEAQEDDA